MSDPELKAVVTDNPLPQKLVIASRESRLAMWQALHVQERLRRLYPQCEVSILGMTTQGDRILDKPLSEIGGKGLFIKELEVALLDGRADLAVHSLKDVPMDMPDGFSLAAIMAREDPRDAFVSSEYADLESLPDGARLGTSSLRRAAQVLAQFPRLKILPLRGNINTRMAKLDRGEYDAIILAAAGLKRLGFAERIRSIIPPPLSLPAAGQGALGIEIRRDREDMQAWLAPLVDARTTLEVTVERAVSRRLGGSCRVPLAAFCQPNGSGDLELCARVAAPDGTEVLESLVSGDVSTLDQADALGERAAADLLAQGAQRWLPSF
ncbi:MAG: hydroxymethylbilane synthase [Burkholderiaceae bacterium]